MAESSTPEQIRQGSIPLPKTKPMKESPPKCGEDGWVGRLYHDRSKHADWGWLRDDAGELIVIVKMPFMEDEQLHEHRRNGTDPAQGRVDAILSALYGQNAIGEARADNANPNQN